MHLRIATATASSAALAFLAGCEVPVSRDIIATQPVRVITHDCTMTTYREHFGDGTQGVRKGIECLGNQFYCLPDGQESDQRCIDRFAHRLDKSYDY